MVNEFRQYKWIVHNNPCIQRQTYVKKYKADYQKRPAIIGQMTYDSMTCGSLGIVAA